MAWLAVPEIMPNRGNISAALKVVNIFGFPCAFVPSVNTSTLGILFLVQDPESQHREVPLQPPCFFTCAAAVSHNHGDSTVLRHPFLQSFQLKERSLFERMRVVFYFLVSFPFFPFFFPSVIYLFCTSSS